MNDNLFRQINRKQIANMVSSTFTNRETLEATRTIVSEVAESGDQALLDYARRFDNPQAQRIGLIERDQMKAAFDQLEQDDQQVLQRTTDRIVSFAKAQLASIGEFEIRIPAGQAGQSRIPIDSVGCYAPGGRYPLPSSVIMTAAVARTAGCRNVMVASPNPTAVTLAAAHVAGADTLLPYGGAHAIAAMAYGTETISKVDMIAGPGNRWVTAAKQLVFGQVAIDMLAGPSELLILADESANEEVVAADLLAQAEHDSDARTWLVSPDSKLIESVLPELEAQLEGLPTNAIARQSLNNGGYVLTQSMDESIDVANQIAPEHLQLQCQQARQVAKQIRHAGCLFIGNKTAEVFGDYGIGPNHTLPTGSTARYRGGLSVFDFLRIRTWIELESDVPSDLQSDMATLAGWEGLAAHKRACLIKR